MVKVYARLKKDFEAFRWRTIFEREVLQLSVLKVLGWVFGFGKWLLGLCLDQTRIKVLTESAPRWPKQSLPIQDDGTGGGLLIFVVTSASKRPVEIIRIEVDYAAPLQLIDPGNRGFFSGSLTQDFRLPFRMYWEGNAEVSHNLQQRFGLVSRSPYPEREQPVRISVYARRKHQSFGGFLRVGRLRVTSVEFRAQVTSTPLYIALPPNCALSSPQPFLIESAMSALGPGFLIVHEALADGSTSSTPIVLPGGEAG